MKNIQDLSVRDYLTIVRRRFWYVAIPSVLVSAAAIAYVWQMPSVYSSEMTLQVANRLLPEDYVGSLIRESAADQIELARQKLESRSFIEGINLDLQLADKGVSGAVDMTVIPPNAFRLSFVAYDPQVAQSVVRRAGERVIQLNENSRRETVQVADQTLDEELRRATADLNEVESRLRAFNERHGGGVPGQTDGAAYAALLSQAAAADTELGALKQKRDALQRNIQEQRSLKLAGRTRPSSTRPATPAAASTGKPQAPTPAQELELKKQDELKQAETELARYTSEWPDYPIMLRKVEQLRQEVAALKQAREAAARATQNPGPAAPEEPADIAALAGLVDDTAFIEAELKYALEGVERDISRKTTLAQDLASQIEQYRRRLNLAPALTQEMNAIERDLKAARTRYDFWSGKKLTSDSAARVDMNANNETFRIVEQANLPLFPSGPNRPMNAAMGCAFAVLLGLGLAFVREYADNTLHDEDEASHQLQLPVLTSVPVVVGERRRKKKDKGNSLSLSPAGIGSRVPYLRQVGGTGHSPHVDPAGQFTLGNADAKVRHVVLDRRTIAGEQYRLMRTTLSLMRKKQNKLKTVLIASTIPNEGKTFTACCLAAVLAQEPGKRVLLIDADFRTQGASSVLGLQAEDIRVGLSDVLKGERNLEQSFLECVEPSLYFLPAGASPGDPTELLGDPALERIIRRCEDLFDWIVIDSPPILALADANLLLPVCDTTLLVVGAEKTPTKLVQDSVSRIGREHICGLVMNGVRSIAPSRYYGPYYYKDIS